MAISALGLAVGWGASRVAAEPTTGAVSASMLVRTSSATALPKVSTSAAATWCGTPSELDSTPNAVAGNPVHWIYAIPSDGQDRFSSFASAMQTDYETIDSWWRGQDPSRTPRGDVAGFPCGLQLDLSAVRLRNSSDQLAAPEVPFDLIWDSLLASGFESEHSKYVVYYDGPVGNEDVCGVAATIPRSLGMAMVFVRSCPGIAPAQVAAHELIHALGAVPNGAPHMCPPPDQGHTCDTPSDLLYPFTDGTPLSGLTLDPGRDDYYGHAGSWPDVQDSPWLVQLDRQVPLELTITGPGSIESDVPGLQCSQNCSTAWNNGTQLVLTPAPAPGARLVRWTGGCSGSSQCALTVGQATSATAFFAPATYRLSVRVSGRGVVRSSSFGIACPGRCASPFSSHMQVRLRATPAKGWKLKGWSGACRGKRAVCSLPMAANTSARALFARR